MRHVLAIALLFGALPLHAQRSSTDTDDRWLENCRESWGDRTRGRACVRMGIPSRFAATIETGTVNGHVNTDFPVTVSGRISRQMTLSLNGGGTRLRAVTTNGSVTLSQR